MKYLKRFIFLLFATALSGCITKEYKDCSASEIFESQESNKCNWVSGAERFVNKNQ